MIGSARIPPRPTEHVRSDTEKASPRVRQPIECLWQTSARAFSCNRRARSPIRMSLANTGPAPAGSAAKDPRWSLDRQAGIHHSRERGVHLKRSEGTVSRWPDTGKLCHGRLSSTAVVERTGGVASVTPNYRIKLTRRPGTALAVSLARAGVASRPLGVPDRMRVPDQARAAPDRPAAYARR
jgi:hypothetical protein